MVSSRYNERMSNEPMNQEKIADLIVDYIESGQDCPHEIHNLLVLDHNQDVDVGFIIETINEYQGYSDDVSDEGFDPYMNSYTDDC